MKLKIFECILYLLLIITFGVMGFLGACYTIMDWVWAKPVCQYSCSIFLLLGIIYLIVNVIIDIRRILNKKNK